MLCEYSQRNSEKLAKICATCAEYKIFFLWGCFYWCTLYKSLSSFSSMQFCRLLYSITTSCHQISTSREDPFCVCL